jgi:hypothetical protein
MTNLIVIIRIWIAGIVGIVRVPGLDRSIACVGVGDVDDAAIGQGGQHPGGRDFVSTAVLQIILAVGSIAIGLLVILRRPPQAVARFLQSSFGSKVCLLLRPIIGVDGGIGAGHVHHAKSNR